MKFTKIAAAAIAASMMAGGASAATLTFASVGAPPPGVNECSGDFGTSPNCEYISADDFYFDGGGVAATDSSYTSFNYGALGQIAKFDFESGFPTFDSGDVEANTILGTGVFSFNVENGTNIWSYNPNGSRATIFAFSVKGSDNYNLYEMSDVPLFSGFEQSASGFFAPNNPNGRPAGISHITFYGKELAPIPLPAAGWLLLAGIGGLAALRRRKSV